MKQGDICLVNLDPTIGSEIKKTRPAIVVSDDALGKLPLRVIVPITDWKEHYAIAPWMVRISPNTINSLTKDSSADCFQMRSISQERIVKKMGKVSQSVMDEIRVAMSKVLSVDKD